MTNNKNFNQKMNTEFGTETDVNQVRQQIQQAEARKQQASGSVVNNRNQNIAGAMNVEFGTETDVNQVRQQIQQAEARKQQASGSVVNNRNQNNNQ